MNLGREVRLRLERDLLTLFHWMVGIGPRGLLLMLTIGHENLSTCLFRFASQREAVLECLTLIPKGHLPGVKHTLSLSHPCDVPPLLGVSLFRLTTLFRWALLVIDNLMRCCIRRLISTLLMPHRALPRRLHLLSFIERILVESETLVTRYKPAQIES